MTNLYPSEHAPAFGTFVAGRVAALRAAGAAVTVVANRDPAAHRRLVTKYASLMARTLTTSLRLAAAGRPPDIVEAHIAYPTGLVAWPAARIARAPLVLFAHGSDITEVAVRSGMHRRLARWLIRGAALVVANSAYLADLVCRRYPEAAGKILVRSPGIDIARFGAKGREPSRGGILFVGRLVHQKGVDVLLDACAGLGAQLQGHRIEIVGDGPERPGLERQAGRLGLDVSFVGAQPPAAVAAGMGSAAIVAVPSRAPEGLGLVALEGMAAGALVVATATGGLGAIVDDGRTGFLAAPGDASAFAGALRRAVRTLARPDEAATMRKAAEQSVAEHDIGRVTAISLDDYRALIRKAHQ